MSSPADRLSAVLDRFERPLLGYAMVRCGDHGPAQDAVQETLLRFFRHAPAGDLTWETIRRLASGAKGPDPDGFRGEFLQVLEKAAGLFPMEQE
jgi:hypothetical protein